jgi:N,N-dimethylformamidase
MTGILGYSDVNAVRPGATIRFMVSCTGAESYDAQIVRLINPEGGPKANPFRFDPIPSPVDGAHPAREQKIDIGSYGVVESHPLIRGLSSLTVQAMVWATTPEKGRQALLGTWSDTEKRGFGLTIDETGWVEFWLGNGREVTRATSGVKLLARRWYLVAASFDAATGQVTLYQEPLATKSFDGEAPVRVEGQATARLDGAPLPFLFAAWNEDTAERPMAYRNLEVGGHFNGRIDRPRVANRALDRAEIAALAGNTVPAALESAIVASWDFSLDISGEKLTDTSANRLHGETVNLPARAMTGHNWTGTAMNWRDDPSQYGAIHFHDDDLYDAKWTVDFAFTVPSDLRSGCYAARLSANEAVFFVPFFVQPPRGKATSKVAYLASTATYTVYLNNRGRFGSLATEMYHGRMLFMDPTDMLFLEHPELGLSTYDRHSDGSGVCYSSRLRPANNFRPSGRLWNFGVDMFLIEWLEQAGLGYDVITDEQLHQEGLDALRPYNVVVTGSHPEYDSVEMLDALDAYLRQGGRLMYMGGNGFYWRIAYHQSKPGVIEVRRAEGGVRAWDAEPGEYYHSFSGEYGGLWRRQGRAPNRLAGVGFIAQGFDHCSYYRRLPASNDPRCAFIFEGVTDEILGDFGALQGGASGLEIDSADPAIGTPPHALIVARSENHSNTYELVPEEVRIPHGASDATINPLVHADMVFFETGAGGAVFSTGSIAYAGSLGWRNFDNNIAKLTTNVLRRFAQDEPFPPPPKAG